MRQRSTNSKNIDNNKKTANNNNNNNNNDTNAKAKDNVLLVHQDKNKKWAGWWRRWWATWSMLGGFALILYGGHIPLLILIFLLQIGMFKEIVSLGHELAHENELPGFRHLHWFWFATAEAFIWGTVLSRLSLPAWMTPDWIMEVARRKTFFQFSMYIAGLVGFVLSLKNGHYKYQFGMFAWCHLAIIMVVIQSGCILINMFNGLIWFLLPVLLVVNNDMWAYFFGFFWGRTPLIKLSPKKTWEGFIGATFVTIIMGYVFVEFLTQYDFIVCPKYDLSFSYASCERGYHFTATRYDLPNWLITGFRTIGLLDWTHLMISPMHFHGIIIAAFASIIAPFGGFFASGFKRAFKFKDFGNSIPGHGGVTDRMDCQIMMGAFAYVYYQTFVASVSEASVILYMFRALTAQQQLIVFERIRKFLQSQGHDV